MKEKKDVREVKAKDVTENTKDGLKEAWHEDNGVKAFVGR